MKINIKKDTIKDLKIQLIKAKFDFGWHLDFRKKKASINFEEAISLYDKLLKKIDETNNKIMVLHWNSTNKSIELNLCGDVKNILPLEYYISEDEEIYAQIRSQKKHDLAMNLLIGRIEIQLEPIWNEVSTLMKVCDYELWGSITNKDYFVDPDDAIVIFDIFDEK